MAFLGENGLAQVWGLICNKHDGFVNEHIWRRTKTEVSSGYTLGEVRTNAVMFTAPAEERYYTANYSVASEVSVSEAGIVSLVNETSVQVGVYQMDISSFAGKFIYHQKSKFNGNDLEAYKIYYVPADATFTKQEGEYVDPNMVSISKIQSVNGYAAGIHTDYVNSPDINAYPQDDGYTYEYLGQLGHGMTRVATGSYVGTDQYKAENSCSLSFDFPPKILFITPESNSQSTLWAVLKNGVQTVGYTQVNAYHSFFTLNGNMVSWYSLQSAGAQANKTVAYHYIAIG